VLLRDILAVLAFLATWLLHRPVALPARAGGKAVTIMQLLTLVAAIADWTYTRNLAWATAAIAVYAIWTTGVRRAVRRGPHAPMRNRRSDGGGAGMRIVVMVLLLFSLFAVADAPAQQFQPPKNGKRGGTRIGLFASGCARAWISAAPASSSWARRSISAICSRIDYGSAPRPRSVCSTDPTPTSGISKCCGGSPTMKRLQRRTSERASAWQAAMDAGPTRSAQILGQYGIRL